MYAYVVYVQILQLCLLTPLRDIDALPYLQAFFGSGYFNEGNASADNNYLKRIESKKLLSAVEKSGLLSKADKAGLTLSRVSPKLSIFILMQFAGLLTAATLPLAKLSLHRTQAPTALLSQ